MRRLVSTSTSNVAPGCGFADVREEEIAKCAVTIAAASGGCLIRGAVSRALVRGAERNVVEQPRRRTRDARPQIMYTAAAARRPTTPIPYETHSSREIIWTRDAAQNSV